MPSLLHTALALPIASTLLFLPPLIQYDASSSSHLRYHATSSIWTWLHDAVNPLVSRAVSLALSQSQKTAILELDNSFPALLASCGLAVFGCWATSLAIDKTKDIFKQRGFKGKDLLKSGNLDELPETMGLPSASVYMFLLFFFVPFRYFSAPASYADVSAALSSLESNSVLQQHAVGWEGRMDGKRGFPHHELASYLSALLSFMSAIVLGFLDDVFDIRWRYKLPIPVISSIPLLVIYYAGGGGTTVVIPGWPEQIRTWLGTPILDLGPLYYVYMSLLSTFCTNSINILAGINGVEVGQALVISISLCINDLLYLDYSAGQPGSRSSEELLRRHLFSLYFLLPLTGVSLGLLAWNRYPAKVFVGDTFCYFAGMVFSAVGILGHFSKTLLLFFVPQIFNFVLSCPQLFGLVPNPRHRVPRIDAVTNGLYPSITEFCLPHQIGSKRADPSTTPGAKPLKPASRLTQTILLALEKLRLVQLEWHPPQPSTSRRYLKSTTNLTLLNAILVFRGVHHLSPPPHHQEGAHRTAQRPYVGPCISEFSLWGHVMAIQALGSVFAFAIRYRLAALVFPAS